MPFVWAPTECHECPRGQGEVCHRMLRVCGAMHMGEVERKQNLPGAAWEKSVNPQLIRGRGLRLYFWMSVPKKKKSLRRQVLMFSTHPCILNIFCQTAKKIGFSHVARQLVNQIRPGEKHLPCPLVLGLVGM